MRGRADSSRRPAADGVSRPEKPSSDPSPLEAAIGRKALERYEAALERLKPGGRNAIILRVELGYPIDRLPIGRRPSQPRRIAPCDLVLSLVTHPAVPHRSAAHRAVQRLSRAEGYLQAVFPNSRFIIITRHPISQTHAIRKWSHRRTQIFGAQFEALVANWVAAHACLREDQSFIRRLLVVRFEDLVLRPGPVLERVENFLDGHRNTSRWEALDRESAFRYARVWHTAIAPGGRIHALLSVPKSRESTRELAKAYVQGVADALLLPRVARRIAERYRSAISDHGYDLDNFTKRRRGDKAPAGHKYGRCSARKLVRHSGSLSSGRH
jgi:PAS domain-containing protein